MLILLFGLISRIEKPNNPLDDDGDGYSEFDGDYIRREWQSGRVEYFLCKRDLLFDAWQFRQSTRRVVIKCVFHAQIKRFFRALLGQYSLSVILMQIKSSVKPPV